MPYDKPRMRGAKMGVRYNKLFKLLIDKKMQRGELCRAAGISASVLAKLTRDENVTVEVLTKICYALECDLPDIMELLPDDRLRT
jgi:DNA-binding Xre family transcriptional regulator